VCVCYSDQVKRTRSFEKEIEGVRVEQNLKWKERERKVLFFIFRISSTILIHLTSPFFLKHYVDIFISTSIVRKRREELLVSGVGASGWGSGERGGLH
jgi:hypothetical protein